MTLETVHIIESSYENVEVDCPHCRRRLRYNRVSDLRTCKPIAGADIDCLSPECRKRFRIIGDTASARFKMLVFDCYPLLEEKRYAQCILNLCQAFECFFSLHLRVVLCFDPVRQGRSLDLDALNSDLERLFETIRTWTFGPLRNTFAAIAGTHGARVPVAEVPRVFNALPEYKERPLDKSIASTADPQMRALLAQLRGTSVDRLRNQVVHKEAYRPSRVEAEEALESTGALLFPLAQAVRVSTEDANWYLHHAV
jgi:hypothetical protein